MPQSCPSCQAKLADTDNFCPECLADFGEPEQESTKPRPSLNTMFVLGRSIQLLFLVPVVLFLIGGFGYVFVVAVARKDVIGTGLSLILLLLFVGSLYAICKRFVTELRER